MCGWRLAQSLASTWIAQVIEQSPSLQKVLLGNAGPRCSFILGVFPLSLSESFLFPRESQRSFLPAQTSS